MNDLTALLVYKPVLVQYLRQSSKKQQPQKNEDQRAML